MLSVIIVEDDPQIGGLHAQFVQQDGRFMVLAIVSTLADAQKMIEWAKPDLVLVDNYLPDGLGIDLVRALIDVQPRPECVLVTAACDVETAQQAYRFGAFDYLVKPVDYRRLAESLQRFYRLRHPEPLPKAVRQQDLDELFHPQRGKASSAIDDFTLEQMLEHFPHAHVEHTADSMALRLGISKSTARRYLDSAVDAGEIIAYLEHGKVGRPTRVYRRPRLDEITR
ncbi:response regulator [Vibrio mimicus]|uniref:response regulator n=1 Tax=Vibrio mimicus TaxID=674 RepID=UPI0011D51D0D|nr:response regulator [Vibrio mimicus]TXY02854.1 response regulator [Vibrio mimicus]